MNSSFGTDINSQQNISTLHPEILSQIFTFCISESPYTSVKRVTLTICHVCSSWRALAIATPALWARFHLSLHHRFLKKRSTQSIVQHIHSWLGRSGVHPLTIRFTSRCSDSTCIQAFKALTSYSSRWETVTIEVVSGSWPNLDEVPLLRTLDVKGAVPLKVTSAPRLTNLILRQIMTTFYPSSSMPWHQLTTITISEWMDDNNLLEVLQHCTCLESLRAKVGKAKQGATPPVIPRIEHGTLKALNLHLYGDSYGFLESVILPALSELRLNNRERKPFYSTLIDFLTSSHCELVDLTLMDSMFTPNELSTLLGQESCHTLTNLCLENSFDNWRHSMVGDENLGQLSSVGVDGGMQAPRLCRNLTKLSMRRCYSRDSSPGLLGTMILSRCSAAQPLSVFNLWTLHDIAEEDKALLELAREKGLKWNIFVCGWYGESDT